MGILASLGFNFFTERGVCFSKSIKPLTVNLLLPVLSVFLTVSNGSKVNFSYDPSGCFGHGDVFDQ